MPEKTDRQVHPEALSDYGQRTEGRRPRLLFVGEALTLAHFVRVLALAEALAMEGYETHVAADPRFLSVAGDMRVPFHAISSMPAGQFTKAVTSGSPIFDEPTLHGYVKEDFRLIDAIAPDIVIGDFRISLGISARLAGVPYICLTNAYWSPYATIRHVVPEFTALLYTGVAVGQWFFRLARPIGYALHALPVNRVRRKFGLAALPMDFRFALTDGDQTAYADVPGIVPTRNLPASHSFIGPVAWAPRIEIPAWWDEASRQARSKPIVYVTLGSSGPPELLETVLEATSKVGVIAIASTAGRPMPRLCDAVHCAQYLPGDLACRLAAAVISNGGSPTTYQGLAEGRPVLGLATNMDQFLNMSAVQSAGCGVLLRSGAATVATIEVALRHTLQDPKVRRNAEQVRQEIAACPTTSLVEGLIRKATRS